MPLSSPQRSCIACRRKTDQLSLLRISANGTLTTTSSGRSAYVCPTLTCLDAALRKDRLGRALRRSIPPEQLTELRRALADRLSQESA